MRANMASNSSSGTRNAQCWEQKSSESMKSIVTPFPVFTGMNGPVRAPASIPRMRARNSADVFLSCAGTMM